MTTLTIDAFVPANSVSSARSVEALRGTAGRLLDWCFTSRQTSTLMREAEEPEWLHVAIHRVFSTVITGRTSEKAAARAALWLGELSSSAPEPMVFPGDDGTVSLEWDHGGSTLHVLFDRDGGEWYFESVSGDTKEGPIVSAGDDLSDALREVVRAEA